MAVLAAGCGYTFAVAGNGIPSRVRAVYVAEVESGKNDPLVADMIARQLRLLILREGRFHLARGPADADAVLHVHIARATTRPVAFDEFDEVLDYETTVAANAELEEQGGAVLWKGKGIASTRAHGAVSGAVVTTSSAFQAGERLRKEDLAAFDSVQLGEQRKSQAKQRLAADLARTIHDRMMEGR